MAIMAPKGTFDLMPGEAQFWLHFTSLAREIFGRYGYVAIETPIIERRELFVRGIGRESDVVGKEMYRAVSDANLEALARGDALKATSDLALRPEGTAGVVRAAVQHDCVPQGAPPAKFMYAGPMFRAENPQAGRQRQFNQIGVECLGTCAATVDAEAIIAAMEFFAALNIERDRLHLLLNSMGCAQCRPAYREQVRAYLIEHGDELCEDCLGRIDTNPLRAFDCKQASCRDVMKGAPKIVDALCDECADHYKSVKTLLAGEGVVFEEDFRLVRGLDYYTRTVFEVQCDAGLGAQNALGGGGRYDGLAEDIGGRPTPGFGFAIGYERCRLVLESLGAEFAEPSVCDLFVACVDDAQRPLAFATAQRCRHLGIRVEIDHQHRSLKSQFKLANKLGAARVVVLGPDEVACGRCTLRDMNAHEEIVVTLEELPNRLLSALL